MNGKNRKKKQIFFQLKFCLFSSSATSIGGRSQPLRNPTLDDLDYKILDVHENLKNRPIFG